MTEHLLGKIDFNTIDLKNGWEIFAQCLLDVLNRFFPLKTRETFSSRMHPSWKTRKIQSELKKRQNFSFKNLVSKIRDLLERLIKKIKVQQNDQKSENVVSTKQSESSMTKSKLNFFKYIRTKQTPSFSQTHTIPELSKLIEFFATIGIKMDAKIKHSSEPVLSGKCKKTLFLFPAATTKTFNICSFLKYSNSEGKDNFPNKFVKFFSPIISGIFVVPIKRCMVEVYFFPNSLKLVRVVRLFRSGDKQDPCNYRHFSVLPSFSKIVKELMYIY